MFIRSLWVELCVALTLIVTSPAIADEPFRILSFAPSGDVRNVSQVHIRFSEEVVAFGDPRDRAAPFTSNCKQPAQSRWVDGKNWAYEFKNKLPGGLRCTFAARSDLQSLVGVALTGKRAFSFSTGGATPITSLPRSGFKEIASDQVFILALDAPVDIASVEQHAYFEVEGIASRIGVSVMSDEDVQKITDGSNYLRRLKNTPKIGLRAKLSFPPGKNVNLVWGRAIETPNGIPTGMPKDQVFSYTVQPPFTVSVRCRRKNESEGCDPLGDIRLLFSSYVDSEKISHIQLEGGARPAKFAETPYSGATQYAVFRPPFAPNTDFRVVIPEALRSTEGATLEGIDTDSLKIATGDFPPLAKFSGRFGILELEDSPILPVTVRNLEPDLKIQSGASPTPQRGLRHWLQDAIHDLSGKTVRIAPDLREQTADQRRTIVRYMRKLYEGDGSSSQSIIGNLNPLEDISDRLSIPRPKGRNRTEVVGIPLEDPGFYVVEIASRNLAERLLHDPNQKQDQQPEYMYVSTGALVTNLGVHLKLGRENALIWVTQLNDAKSVEHAKITVLDCAGEQVWQGETNGDGVAISNSALEGKRCDRGWRDYESGVFVFAEKDGDVSFAHSSWTEGISTWRFAGTSHNSQNRKTPIIGHTVLDRSLLRAGETVSMKHFLRRHHGEGIDLPDNLKDWKYVEIVHSGSRQRFSYPLHWDASGTAQTAWNIPKAAKLGSYIILFKKDAEDHDYTAIQAGEFDVQEFKVPLTKGTIKGPSGNLVRTTKLPLDMGVHYLAGGGASNMPIKLRTNFTEVRSAFASKAHPDFTFNAPAPSLDPWVPMRRTLDHTALKLDDAGMTHYTITDVPVSATATALEVTSEMSYRDPNGNLRTVIHRKTIHPSNWNVGVKAKRWIPKDGKLTFTAIVLDLDGNPVPSQAVKIDLVKRENISHRKKLAGGVYGYEHETKITPLGQFCEGTTDDEGRLSCEAQSEHSGNIYGVARVEDPDGLELVSSASTWVPGEDRWWFRVSDTDQMDVLAEQRNYEPGDDARFQVRMPFQAASALVTIEREGVLDYFVQDLSGNAPVVSVPVRDTYAPNVYVSVLAIRGRVSDIKPTAMIDLGRPSFKLGMTEIEVGWRKHRLDVTVEAEKPVYEIRDTATVRVHVEAADGKSLPKHAEVAIAAVDAGLLELKANNNWKLLDAMMGLRSNEIETATAQMQVVGKRHYGQKAVSDGGGGGRSTVRELFDTLVLWKGTVALDENGDAVVHVPLNDSLTQFKIVAIASAGADKFGTGSTNIRTTQSLMVFAGIAPLVREGDRIETPFTFRNTTSADMNLSVALDVEGLDQTMPVKRITVPAHKSVTTNWQLTIPYNKDTLQYRMEVRDGVNVIDAIVLDQVVVTAVPVRALQGTFAQLDKPFNLTGRIPDDAVPGRGGMRLDISASLVDVGLIGVIDYMRQYPYSCFEQTASKALALDDKAKWDTLMDRMGAYLDGDGLIKYFPLMQRGSVTLSAYVLATAHERGWEIPKQQRMRVLGALRNFITGRLHYYDRYVEEYLTIVKLQSIEALSRYELAIPAMLDSIEVIPQNLPTSALIDWVSILHRVKGISDAESLRAQSIALLRSRIYYDGRIMRFTTSERDDLWWFMTGGDSNASRTVSAALEFGLWPQDQPRLLEGALSRQKEGHWSQTTSNALGALALRKFAAAYEKDKVSGKTDASFGPETATVSWGQERTKHEIVMPWGALGEERKLDVRHNGEGAPWVSAISMAAVPFKEPFDAGFAIEKMVTPITRRTKGQWSIGDEIRVHIEVKAPADMSWVVIDDPVPAGATIMGRGLGGESALSQVGEASSGSAYLAFKEQAFEGMRAYYSYVRQGKWSMDYTYRLNAAGSFQLPATRVEAMYKPEMFGVLPNETFVVEP